MTQALSSSAARPAGIARVLVRNMRTSVAGDSARHAAASQQCSRGGASGIGPAAYCVRRAHAPERRVTSGKRASPPRHQTTRRRRSARLLGARRMRRTARTPCFVNRRTRKYADVLAANSRFVASKHGHGARQRGQPARQTSQTQRQRYSRIDSVVLARNLARVSQGDLV